MELTLQKFQNFNLILFREITNLEHNYVALLVQLLLGNRAKLEKGCHMMLEKEGKKEK